MAVLVALVLVAVLAVTGLFLTWAYRPAPVGPELIGTVHRVASSLLLPVSWVLVFALVQARARTGREAAAGRSVGRWVVPALLVLAVPVATFTGFLLPWERVFYATVVLAPDVRGMGPAFDAAVSAVSFGGAPVPRPTFQRYVLAHLFLGVAVTVLTLLVARSARVRGGGRTRRGRGSPRPGRTAAPPPRTTG